MLLDDAAIVPVYQRGRAYLQRESIKNMYNHKYGGDLSFKWASVENKKKQVITCFLIRTFLINTFPANLVPAGLDIQTFINKLHLFFSAKEFFTNAICNDTNQCCYSDDEGSNRDKINKKQSFANSPLPVCMFIV